MNLLADSLALRDRRLEPISQPAQAASSRITIAIVNHNTREHLAACLTSIPSDGSVRVLVLDNDSTDGSSSMVHERFPWAEVHVRSENRGFGAGANAAMNLCRTPYVLLLNSDTRLSPDAPRLLAAYLDAHPQVAVAGPRLLNPDGSLQPSCHSIPSPFTELLRWTSLGVLAARLPGLREACLSRSSHDYARPVGWLVGAAIAIRKHAFDQVGGFDESFFMYSEEVDLMYRLRRAGWHVHYAPVTDVVHDGGASTEQQRAAMTARLYISIAGFYARHFGAFDVLQVRLLLTHLMLRNVASHYWSIRRAPHKGQQTQLQEELIAWRQVLRHLWSRSIP